MSSQPWAARSWSSGRRVVWPWVVERDLAVAYAAVVLGTALYIHSQPGDLPHRLVLQSSTNLENLRTTPVQVLVTSGAVVSDLDGLWMLVPLVLAYGEAQRWLGRGPTLVVAAIGHVGATLFVASLLVAGIHAGRLDSSLVRAPDVGVSYGLATILGLLTVRVPRRRRLLYVGGLVAFFAGPILVSPNFTDVGHITALALGFGLSLLASRAAEAS